ncbi:protein of unknown function (plasmid) [Caballeronia sp. S22]
MLSLSPRNAVGVGYAQNDRPLLDACKFSAAVGNALGALKSHADVVLAGEDGPGAVELIDRILADDLASVDAARARGSVTIGQRNDVTEALAQSGTVALIAGRSGGGKSTLLAGLMERLCAAGYQFCALDPEGDFEDMEQALMIGDGDYAPKGVDVMRLLRQPRQSVIANLMQLAFDERPLFAPRCSHRCSRRAHSPAARTG